MKSARYTTFLTSYNTSHKSGLCPNLAGVGSKKCIASLFANLATSLRTFAVKAFFTAKNAKSFRKVRRAKDHSKIFVKDDLAFFTASMALVEESAKPVTCPIFRPALASDLP